MATKTTELKMATLGGTEIEVIVVRKQGYAQKSAWLDGDTPETTEYVDTWNVQVSAPSVFDGSTTAHIQDNYAQVHAKVNGRMRIVRFMLSEEDMQTIRQLVKETLCEEDERKHNAAVESAAETEDWYESHKKMMSAAMTD